MSRVFSKPILAKIKASVAELFTHTKLNILFQTYDFTLQYASPSNKIERISGYIDHLDWSDHKNTVRMFELLTEVYLQNQHLIELANDSSALNNSIHAMKSLDVALKGVNLIWNGASFGILRTSKFDAVKTLPTISSIQEEIRRTGENLERDPADALTAAEGVIVSTCKAILEKSGVAWGQKPSPQDLVKLVMEHLQIHPDNISDEANGSKIVKKVLRSLTSVVHSLNELRDIYGDAHGKAPSFKGLQSRHARLAVGAAETIAIYLLETYQWKNKK